MIRHLLFDMGGIIFQQNTEEAFRRFAEMGIDTDRYMGRYGQKEFFLDVETGAIDAATFCKKLATATGKQEITWQEAQHAWLGFVDEVPQKSLNHLEKLKKEYHLSLLSNTNPFVMDYMRSDNFSSDGRTIEDFFDTLFCSYELKLCKPHPEIYLQALQTLGAEAHECVFIDDSKANIEAAQALGIHVLHVETNADWMPSLQALLQQLASEGRA